MNNILGRGLTALFEDVQNYQTNAPAVGAQASQAGAASSAALLDINKIIPDKDQPRKFFSKEHIYELSESIKEHGVIQPIIVRKVGDNYQIIAGERRWQAAKLVGLTKIPAIIRVMDDNKSFEISLIENIQRQDLMPIEEAEGYNRLIEDFGYTHEKLSKIIGKSRSHVTNFLRLLGLPQRVKDLINGGQLSMGHAKALISAGDMDYLVDKIIKEELSVRDTEKLLRSRDKRASKEPSKDVAAPSGDLESIEEMLTNIFGLKVKIEMSEKNGKIVLFFDEPAQLDEFIEKVSN